MMSEIERQVRGWRDRLLAWLRGAQNGDAARKARETLQDVRTSDAGQRAESALRDLRDSDATMARPRRPSATCGTAKRSARLATPLGHGAGPARGRIRGARLRKPCAICGTARRAAASPDLRP